MTRFSVVVPCRDERERLSACLSALEGQDMPAGAFEMVVVDACADGHAAEIAKRGVRVVADERRGPGAARNIGIRQARGDVIAFTDADCVPRFDWLSKLDEAFRADPDAAGFAGALRLPRATLIGRLEDADARVNYDGFITSNIAYRRDVLESVGGFDETLPCAEDYDLAWRILDAGHRIERAQDAIVLHDPPEVHAPLGPYLAKQFWYARHDVPAHVRALGRVWRATGATRGSDRAAAGLVEALARSSAVAAATAAAGARSPGLLGIAAAATLVSSARHVARTVARVGEGASELPGMALVETAKRAARGLGTLVGLAELARPSSVRALRQAGPAAWPRPLPAASPRAPSPA